MSLDKYATAIEREIATRIVDDALKAGYLVSVDDGEETTVKRSADRATILGAMATTSDDRLIFRDALGAKVGWVLLIWGNDCDLISDHTASAAMETLLAGAFALGEAASAKG